MNDPKSKVACETACKDNMVMVFGEITTGAKLDYEKIVRTTVQGIGYDSFVDDLSQVKDGTCEEIEDELGESAIYVGRALKLRGFELSDDKSVVYGSRDENFLRRATR